MFGFGDCGNMGVFDPCKEEARQKAQKVEELGEYAERLGQNIQ